MKNSFLLITFLLTTIITMLLISLFWQQKREELNPYANVKIEIKVFQNDKSSNFSGWGYDIYLSDHRFVHQPHIPGISGNEGFKSKEDAEKVAKLVVSKIRRNIIPPTVTLEELKALKVIK